MSTTTLHTARKTRPCGGDRCGRLIEAGHLYVRHVGFPGDEGCEEITRPWTIENCTACADRGGDWIRSYYNVPAAVGGRIVFTHDGRTGTIVTFAGGSSLNVTFDGERGTVPLHPTDVTYLDADGGTLTPVDVSS